MQTLSTPTKKAYTEKKGKITLFFNGKYHNYECVIITDTETGKTSIEDIKYKIGASTDLFQWVEKQFNKFIDDREGTELYDMYFEEFEGQGTFYSKRGAIQGGIDLIFEYVIEENITYLNLDKDGNKVDIECAFQD
jgi:hypothetical protein